MNIYREVRGIPKTNEEKRIFKYKKNIYGESRKIGDASKNKVKNAYTLRKI
jgi:hypothetical protein